MSRPRILLTTATQFRDYDLRREDSLTGRNYSQAVEWAGGLPLMVANLEPGLADEYLERIDGVLFTGGADIDPALFGQEPVQELGKVDRVRDEFELALYRAARARELPILGVCRGIQLINVAQGGTLHQHLPSVPGTIGHSQAGIDGTPSHYVDLEPDSRLARGLGEAKVRANSYHHQAIDRLGEGLRVTGRTSDGVVEVIEAGEGAPLLAVQWHPEMSFTRWQEHLLPFQLLVEDARRVGQGVN